MNVRVRGRGVIAAAAAVLTIGAVTACAGATPAAEPAASSATSVAVATVADVDVAALDTGDYPTSPAPAFGDAPPEEVVGVDAQRMAEFVVAPYEIDPELDDPTLPTLVVRNYKMLKGVFDQTVIEVPANQSSALYGFITSATTPTADRGQRGRALTNLVMRYTDPTAAADAARQMSEAAALRPGAMAVEIPGMPGSYGISGTELSENVTLAAFTPRNDYVLYTWISAPQDQAARLEPSLVHALELQGPLIDRFPRLPTKAQNGGQRTPLEIDQNDILIYALPAEEDAPLGDIDRGVYGPRGMSHFYLPPAEVFRTLTEHGSEHNAVYKTTVYRADTEQDATEMLTEFDTMNRTGGWTSMASPQGLPNAHCFTRTSEFGEQFYCSVQVGRYIGEATALDDRTDVLQQISAQYLILTQADQSAD